MCNYERVQKIISNEETYGYEIYSKLNAIGLTDFAEGSLYPLLLRLEKSMIFQW